MKLWTLLLVNLLALNVFAQREHQVDLSNAVRFIKQQKSEVIHDIWNKVKEGKITIYQNDSLAKPMSLKEVYHFVWDFKGVMYRDSLDPKQIRKNEELTVNNCRLIHYFRNTTPESYTMTFRSRALALSFEPQTESGIKLGHQPWFLMRIEEVLSVLSQEHAAFLQAYLNGQMIYGKLNNPYFYDRESYQVIGSDIAYKAAMHDMHYQNTNPMMDSAIAQAVISTFDMMYINHVQRAQPLYVDALLTQEADYARLVQKLEVPVPNPDNPDDPYDFISYEIQIDFFEAELSTLSFVENANDRWVVSVPFQTDYVDHFYVDLTDEFDVISLAMKELLTQFRKATFEP